MSAAWSGGQFELDAVADKAGRLDVAVWRMAQLLARKFAPAEWPIVAAFVHRTIQTKLAPPTRPARKRTNG
jgi:hypothetical protein